MGNIKHHYEGEGGPDWVTIALVVHGPALKAFLNSSASTETTEHTKQLSNTGLQLNACANTMRSLNITLQDLLPGFISADRGGVVRLAELQAEGYVYLRP
jgi:intracellular sulfur oxidation DsrE/DsrF family protein